jgi:GNAT superfamily N-acetyltransferase
VSSTPDLRFEIDPELDDDLVRKLTSLWVDVSNAGGAVGFVPPVTEEQMAEVTVRAFEAVKTGRDRVVVAYEGNEPVGFLFLVQRPGPLFRHWATVKRLQVHPTRQGWGIGRRLLEETQRVLRDEGLEQLHLTVRGGTGTESFYESLGYEVKARIPGVIRVDAGDDREEIYMVRLL